MRAFFLILFASLSSFAYRYVCNGFKSEGIERQDKCGPCDEEHAARWSDPVLNVLVSTSITPLGISAEQWWQVVEEAFRAWESVPGVKLRFNLSRGDAGREFGANSSVHELFVIRDVQEWQEKTSVGPIGVLGATLPTYICQGPDENDPNSPQKREIIDSDLVINATGSIVWKLNCADDNCVDPLTTLVHEIGHWLGLDHPCLLCSWSIMSARAGYDLIYPLFDDMQGIRSLYPDRQNTSGFGSSCSKNSECNSNLCVEDQNNNYCSNTCVGEQDCRLGTNCTSSGTNKYCLFASGESSLGKKEGDNCNNNSCVEPLICAGATSDNSYCFKPCYNNIACKANQECIKISGASGLCVSIKNLGESCDGRELCADDLYCVIENNIGFCRAPCARKKPEDTGCEPQHNCKIFGPGHEVCLPDELSLGSNSLGFNENPELNNMHRDLQNIKSKQSFKLFSGCSTPGNINNIAFLWAFMLLIGLRLLRA